MQYKVLTAQVIFSQAGAIEKLMTAVNEAISLGWEPLGSIAFGDTGLVAQAMIKRR